MILGEVSANWSTEYYSTELQKGSIVYYVIVITDLCNSNVNQSIILYLTLTF